ncbi:hypothetical protein D8B26_006287 [Coccidioides posadasii str. Silveira]|uniref:Zn(2)-C6 fungal-type domain-containing protein n=2 Tax=Coccidioides posadasii TaxID=199306 RepID=E9CSP0_COCPS|nr:Fungal specific transcription factor, putative [Coccidioides posadasii C735 delta SOWgp]EER27623.1 Fungal specific transcription factor, putative [Coccidioides posadasii C735 delta SOWgp]EFW22700.1 hypothetical protein CPSG_00599 [Coccidioides posadasii str. Silveira]QVM11641.1 hypothetical protein D8B26_006287 [Coccidioides posadasii str. Silveira]|eukprot:XP_003069768.1 Fungal specific transcription factor, putative [Coccidioides posadasii C735 delta SOWgp]
MSLPSLNHPPTITPGRTLSTPVSDLPQAEVDAIIRTKRKAREPKACYPCHTRKVKCDRNLPCDGCVKRDHADLCSYERPSKKRQVIPPSFIKQEGGDGGTTAVGVVRTQPSAAIDPNRVSLSRDEWENVCSKLKEMEQTISSLRMGMERIDVGPLASPEVRSDNTAGVRDPPSPDREGIHASNELGNGTIHLGSRSVLAYILGGSGTSTEAAQALSEGGILPKLGLDNELVTYPFIDLWSSNSSTFDINAVCSALPDDEQCYRLFRFYRDIGGTIYPVIPDINHFEANLERFLQNRSSGVTADGSEAIDKPFGMSIAFIGLLFAVLAAGCQASDMSGKERELTSQVYVCCSYQCLRAINFVSQPNLQAIQTLLIIGNVLSHNMNPGASYVLLGMTLRMVISLGLQVESHKFSPAERYIRRKVWWSTAWQDSHFSLSYDRPSTMAFGHPDIPYRANSQPGNRSFFETLCRIIALTLEIVRSRMLSPQSQMSFAVTRAYREEIRRILADAAPHLRDPKFCTTPKQNLERLGLKLHSSYIASELCRPALKVTADPTDATTAAVRKECIQALSRTVEAYVELHAANPQASRSWISLQRTISSAFLLAVLEESKHDAHIRCLLLQLEHAIAERTAADATDKGPSPGASKSVSEGSPHLISGVTNIPTSTLDPTQISTTSTIPASVATDTETQWQKPLTKSLRALQKLNAAFSMHSRQQQVQPIGSLPSMSSSPGVGVSISGYVTPSGSIGGPSINATRAGSLPPPTPESSGSSDWNLPNLLDRAAEYIHPPLWP